MSLDRLRENLTTIRARIAQAARRSGRAPEAVRLVAVTKKRPLELVRELVGLGAYDLGENFPQELWSRADALADLPIRWHLIGHLQSNKARRILPLAHLIHGVDSLKLLTLLNELAAGPNATPGLLLQVNTSGEVSKHGWSPAGLLADAEAAASCRNVSILGLMTMAALGTTPDEARVSFVRLRELRDALRTRVDLPLNELSMGMSNDYEAAVEEGATIVRVGSALFEGVET